ncbi:MAG: hypothetical protein IKP38_07735 [Clostridia bacterium]|nr:hypothetical protein [Clostridia bacterium]
MWFITKKSNSIPGGASKNNSTPKWVLLFLEVLLPHQTGRRASGSMRGDSEMNDDPVNRQSRIVTEPQREAPPKEVTNNSVFLGFFLFCLVLVCRTGHKVDTVLQKHPDMVKPTAIQVYKMQDRYNSTAFE